MNTYKGATHRVSYTEPGSAAIDSGDVVVLGDMISIAVADIAISGTGVVEIDNVHELAATSADEWSVGDQLYWDATNKALTNVALGHIRAGVAAEDKAAATVLADVCLNLNSSAEGFVVYNTTSLIAALAACTATNNKILLRPAVYLLAATLELPAHNLSLTGLGAVGDVEIVGPDDDSVTPLIEIAPTGLTSTVVFQFDHIYVEHGDGVGIQIDNAQGGSGRKIILSMRDCETGGDEAAIDVDHDLGSEGVCLYIDDSYIEGKINFDCGNDDDRLYFKNCQLDGVLDTTGDNTTLKLRAWNCMVPHGAWATNGGQTSQVCICMGSFSYTNKTTIEALDTNEIGASSKFTETILP